MKLTKEECDKALDNLYILWDKSISNKDRDKANSILIHLIDEHFELVKENEELKRMLNTFK